MKFTTPLVFIGLLLAAGCASAQQVYRIVGPDGKISFSDTAPVSAAGGSDSKLRTATPTGSGTDALPYELRSVVAKYPVALYTGDDCAPCASGRSLLVTRGIPFVERTVTTSEDGDALQRLSGQTSLPVLTIGSQQLKGFSDVEWSQYLDAAGYPKSSTLPASYQNAAATPLVALRAASVSAPAAKVSPVAPPVAPRAPVNNSPNPKNPAGIQF